MAKTEEGLRAFYKWFGDSKVVDEQGRPLVVYRGASTQINNIDWDSHDTKGNLGGGAYFVDNRNTAEKFGNVETPVYLRLENPMSYGDMLEEDSAEELKEYIEEEYIDTNDALGTFESLVMDYGLRKAGKIFKEITGYDGAFSEYYGDTQYTTWEPQQIKSVDNRGTFSKESNNIYYQSEEDLNNAVDLTDVFQGKPTAEQVETYLNSLINKPMDTASSPLQVQVTEGNKAHVVRSNVKLNKSQQKRQNTALATLENVVNNALKTDRDGTVDLSHNGEKTLKHKANVEQYVYFETPVRIGEQYYIAELATEQVKGQDPNLLDLYNVRVKRNFPNEPSDKMSGSLSGSYENSIANKGNLVNNNFQNDKASPRGMYEKGKRTITLFERANRSTAVHEIMHSWSDEMNRLYEQTKSEKIKQDIAVKEAWTEQEFARKFEAVERANGYAVIDKETGNVVYDRNGNGFGSEEQAKEYAKEEIFARGFETFLMEGKSPSKTLRQVFLNFMAWLKRIYQRASALNIELSPEVRNLYSELLGGADLDFFLNNSPEAFVEKRLELSGERKKYLDDIITRAVNTQEPAPTARARVNNAWVDSINWLKGLGTLETGKPKTGKGLSEIWEKSMIPLSTVAGRISPKIKKRMRDYEFAILRGLKKKYEAVEPFLKTMAKMSREDQIALDYALKNDYVDKRDEVLSKYGAEKQFESVSKMLNEIYDQALNAGIDLGYRPDYFPRKVKDASGLLGYLHGRPEWTMFEEVLEKVDPKGTMKAEEQVDFIDNYLRGFTGVNAVDVKYGSEKARGIDVITPEINQFYSNSIESLILYVEGMNRRIATAQLLGGEKATYEESIGGYIKYLLDNGQIKESQVDDVREILQARLGERGVTNQGLKSLRDLSYIYTMGGINSAITQIDDLGLSVYKGGWLNTLSAMISKNKVTIKDLGLDVISDEFRDSSKLSKALNKVFKATGLTKIDTFAKETLINAVLKKYQKMDTEDLRRVLEPILEDSTADTIEDIKKGVLSDDVLYILFNDLSDMQPLTKSELPAYYNQGGNLRILYMLKSFAIKRIDTFRTECFDKIRTPGKRKEGMQNLMRLAFACMLLGVNRDFIIDLLYGRKVDLSETVINNLLGLVGISKFQVYQARDRGFTSVFKDLTIPPIFAVFDDLIGDVKNVAEGKRNIKDMEVLKGIPLAGRFYYWWVGRGREKENKKNKKTTKY
jgi:hypothetical protein